ncbi:MAG: Smr/MutS family protein, partial [Lachnospiraceae bacterium]|nr:Smr/MutS family protein [Lachnospiraceae bacterium]
KLGLSGDIIRDAKERVTSDAQAFEDVISDLEDTRAKLEQEKKEASRTRKEIDHLKRELREKNEKLEDRKERIIEGAREEAERILAEAKEYADETIRKYTKWAKSDKNIREMEAERTKLREKIGEAGAGKKQQKKAVSKTKASDLLIGSDVRILSMNTTGTVSTLPNEKGELFVQAGLLRTKVKLEDIEVIKEQKQEKPQKKNAGGGRIRMDKSMEIHQEVNLIGMTVDEAMPVLLKYLDDAYLAHLSQVRVIHGRGTGALRKAVHVQLKKMKYVKSYRLGEFGEGDEGVTVVEFK